MFTDKLYGLRRQGADIGKCFVPGPSPPSVVVSLGIAAFVAWRLYSRFRRSVGRQKLSSARPWITVTLFPALIALLLLRSIAHPGSTLAIVAGSVLGAILGIYGLRLTKFEQTGSGWFYTPNLHLGIALSLLLLGRIAYRVVQVYLSTLPAAATPMDFVQSPLTLLIFGTLAGYYVTYAVGLLRWRLRVTAGTADAELQPPRSSR
jgi:hypothetical protein